MPADALFPARSCPGGKVAPSCLSCDNYCLNGGTCTINPKTQLPECQ